MKGDSLVREVIDKKLYPEGKFPRQLFPYLVTILTGFYKKNCPEIPAAGDNGEKISEIISLKALLHKAPGTLVLIYKDLIFKYIFKRHPVKDEVEEIVQEIMTRLLKDKINGIRRRFNFDDPAVPTFTSYFLVTIRNIYIDIIRKEIRGKNLVESESEIEKYDDKKRSNMLNTLILEEEFRKFNALLKLYHNTAPKLSLTLKVKYNIPIDDADILSCFPDCTENEKRLFYKQNGYILKNRKNMERIVPVFNKYESKSNNPDTLRKWVSTKLEEIKRQMNHVHPKKPYNNSTISDLIILFFNWKNKQGGQHE